MQHIRFSHNYPKLWNQTTAKLINVCLIDAATVASTPDLLAKYINPDGSVGYYALPQLGKLIQLTFIGNKRIPFCTLRLYDVEKYNYFYTKMNTNFDIVVEGV